MGVELDLSELAVLRPIQTAAAGDETPTAARRPAGHDADGPDAADTGCVTPTAKSSLLPRMGLGAGGLLDIDAVTDTGCITPTAKSSLLPRMGLGAGVMLDIDAAADTVCVTPTAKSSLLPRMGLGAGGLLDIDASAALAACTTPTASPCLLRPATECPPAPRKPARPPRTPDKNRRKRCCVRPGLQRAFFPVPNDLSTVFVPRGPAADMSPAPPRAAKKIRLHVVG